MFLTLFLFIYILSLFSSTMKECSVAYNNKSQQYKNLFKRSIRREGTFITSLPEVFRTPSDDVYYSTMLYSIKDLHRDQHETRFINKHKQNKTGKLKKLDLNKKVKEEDEAQLIKQTIERLFQLFQKLGLNVNNNLIMDLRHLLQKFNKDGIKYNIMNRKSLIGLSTDKNNEEFHETLFVEVTDEVAMGKDLITTEQSEYLNDEDTEKTVNEVEYELDTDTTVNPLNETNDDYENTTQNFNEKYTDYDDEIEFRQSQKNNNAGKGKNKKDSKKNKNKENDKKSKDKKREKNKESKGKDKKNSIGKNKKEGKEKDKEGKDIKEDKDKKVNKKKSKTKTGKEKGKKYDHHDEKEEQDEITSDDSKLIEITTPSQNLLETTNSYSYDDDNDVITIRRVKGIWIGGHCRCNYFIRSSANDISRDFIFMLFCIYSLKITICKIIA